MAEEDDVIIKPIETKRIPVDSIETSHLEVRVTQVTKGLKDFAEQIREVGLIQPIVVYRKKDTSEEKYELLAGQRRFLAHKDHLHWQKIFAMIIEEPKDEMMKKTISWLENEARRDMVKKDKYAHIIDLQSKNKTKKQILKILGITSDVYDAAITLPRMPDVVREAVLQGEIDPLTALRATDAKRFEKGVTDESKGEDVLKLAKLMMQNKLTKDEKNNIAVWGQENPAEDDNQTIMDEGRKKIMEEIKVVLMNHEAKRLDKYAESQKSSRGESARELILDGLDDRGE